MCEQLEHIGIPETLDHGDLNLANILHKDNKYTIIDFGDSAISHPFFSIIYYLGVLELKFKLSRQNIEYHSIKNSYSKKWLGYCNQAEFNKALGIASIIFPFFLYYHPFRARTEINAILMGDKFMVEDGINGLVNNMNMFNEMNPQLYLSNF